MIDITPTTVAMAYLTENGFSDEFLMYVTKYSANLLKEARMGYISFMGPTLEALEALVDLNDAIMNDADIAFYPSLFIEEHIIVLNDGSYATVGEQWVLGLMTKLEILELAKYFNEVLDYKELGVPKPEYRASRLGTMVPASKAGVSQVW